MLGSAIITLPWTFYNSGVILGSIITILSFLVGMRTCILILRITGPGEDFYDTMFKYWGNWGYYISILCTLAIIITACTSYFIIMAQMLYSNLLAIFYWIFGVKLPASTGIDFK